MFVFLLTKKVCKSLTSAMARYWWSCSLHKKSMHWISWNNLATLKIRGGMGFCDLHPFNVVLLGKHGCSFMIDPSSLGARVLKGWYFPNCEVMQPTVPNPASVSWRTIVAGREALQPGLINGSLSPILNPADTELVKPSDLVKVSELIDSENLKWRSDLTRSASIVLDATAILNIPLWNGSGKDFFAWSHERSGVYSLLNRHTVL
jgi:hypothetical protein